jgi:mono/diheme cytochrome c family protein
LNQPIATPNVPLQKTAWLLMAAVAATLAIVLTIYQLRQADPYLQHVQAIQGDAHQGRVIFQLNCAGCHGMDATGLVGPSLQHVASRKSRVGLINQVTSGKTPPMPQFQPSPQEMADLLKYLESI